MVFFGSIFFSIPLALISVLYTPSYFISLLCDVQLADPSTFLVLVLLDDLDLVETFFAEVAVAEEVEEAG